MPIPFSSMHCLVEWLVEHCSGREIFYYQGIKYPADPIYALELALLHKHTGIASFSYPGSPRSTLYYNRLCH